MARMDPRLDYPNMPVMPPKGPYHPKWAIGYFESLDILYGSPLGDLLAVDEYGMLGAANRRLALHGLLHPYYSDKPRKECFVLPITHAKSDSAGALRYYADGSWWRIGLVEPVRTGRTLSAVPRLGPFIGFAVVDWFAGLPRSVDEFMAFRFHDRDKLVAFVAERNAQMRRYDGRGSRTTLVRGRIAPFSFENGDRFADVIEDYGHHDEFKAWEVIRI